MKSAIVLYGFMLAILAFFLKFIEYHFFVRNLSLEFYLGLVAVLFTAVGIWAGMRLTQNKTTTSVVLFQVNEDKIRKLGLSKRECEVLELMAQGLSNQEIADRLFVSRNTIKTHCSNLFLKLESTRRTQAIRKAKELRLIP